VYVWQSKRRYNPVSPQKGGRYTVSYKGREFTGTVERVARVRSGAVLAWLREYPHVGIPVSKYATWLPAIGAKCNS
jgi:hypothetical protein